MRGCPAGSGLVRERSELPAAVGLKLNLLAQVVGKTQRVREGVLVHGNQGWGKHGGIAARQRVFVVGSRKDEHVLVIPFFDRAQELVAALDLLQSMLRDAEREINDLALPDLD